MYSHLTKTSYFTNKCLFKNQLTVNKLNSINKVNFSSILNKFIHHNNRFSLLNKNILPATILNSSNFIKNNFKTCIKSQINNINSKFFCTPTTNISKEMIREQSQDILNDEDIMKNIDPMKIRNIAIIAHVDHGKTTLVDCMLSQSGINIDGSERAMDNNELEKERGITILSKCTAISYNGIKINIVDTPGHQDFGGEVERIMGMVDSVCLVVCATEGPMPQTRFVLSKALARGLKPIVVINKVDRDTARVVEVENEVFELFIALEASEEQMNYEVVYASAKNGWATKTIPSRDNPKPNVNVFPLLDTIVSKVAPPIVDLNKDFTMLVSQIESNNFFGKMLIGRIESGVAKTGMLVTAVDQNGTVVETNKIFKMVRRFGTKQIEINEAGAGDIVLISGLVNGTVTHTINKAGNTNVIKVRFFFEIKSYFI